ncbi:MAG: hypothetical protein R3Y29_07520 [bacterium]
MFNRLSKCFMLGFLVISTVLSLRVNALADSTLKLDLLPFVEIISDGINDYTYHFEIINNSSSSSNSIDDYYFEVVYPDGSTYSKNQNISSWSDDYYVHMDNPNNYIDGETLFNFILENLDTIEIFNDLPKASLLGVTTTNSPDYKKTHVFFEHPLLFTLIILVSILSIAYPSIILFLSHGWKFENAQPSELALFTTRMSGVIGVVVMLIILFD